MPLLPSCALICLAALAASPASAQTIPKAPVPDLVTVHCGECHTGADAERGFTIEALFTHPDLDREGIDLALQRLRSRTMPPPDATPTLTDAARRALLLAFAARVPCETGARITTMRRLTRTQYEHTVRDLVGIAWSGQDRLPDDASAHGFDTIGDVASVTPMQFETYFVAAGEIAAAVLDSPTSRAKVFPPQVPLAELLPALLERAFRRPPLPAEIAERMQLVADLGTADPSDAAGRAALLQSILASPAFLCRAELGQPEAPQRLTAHELAGRLSYLLTASMPDDALLASARSGALLAPATLVAEGIRLLTHDGGRALADDFAAQWLRFRAVLTSNADFRRYPEIWNGHLRPALYEEAAQLFTAVVRENLSVLTLLDADFTFVDATLAKHYGLPPMAGEGFQRVALSDRRRGGVLGLGAMLMVTSYPLRTSPVQRGKWILDVLLDAGTPPPPPNIPTLPNDDVPVDAQSLRARLERHRRDKGCAGCHAQIDPLGFALENYDVLGRWRADLHGQPLDVKGTLPDGTQLDGPIALKDALLARQDDFVRTMASKLLTFAIGRSMLAADEAELDRIVLATATGEYRFAALLAAVITSPLFTHRDPDPR